MFFSLLFRFLPSFLFRFGKSPFRLIFKTYKIVLLAFTISSLVLNLLSLLPILIIVGAFLAAIFLVVKPYLTYRSYKDQGAEGYFTVGSSFWHDRSKDATRYGDSLKYFKDIINSSPSTRFFVSNVGTNAMLHLSDPDLIKEFVNNPREYKKSSFIGGINDLLDQRGVYFAEGDAWKKQRRALASSFHQDMVRSQVPVIAQIADEAYKGLKKSRDSLDNVDITEVNRRISGDFLGQMFFGRQYSGLSFGGKSITEAFQELQEDGSINMFNMWNTINAQWVVRGGWLPKYRRLRNRIGRFRGYIKEVIQKARRNKSSEENTILRNLLKRQEESTDVALTDDEIADNFISLFIAGVEPVQNLASTMFYHLSKNPEVREKVKSEVDGLPRDSRDFDLLQIQKLDYTLAVTKETLRLANPQALLNVREAVKDHQLGDINVQKGTLVTYSPMFSSFNEAYFLNADEFKPERWFAGNELTNTDLLKRNPFGFIPFSAGPRTCLGQHLSLIEAKVMTAAFLRNFRPQENEDYDMQMINRRNYEPVDNVMMSLTPV